MRRGGVFCATSLKNARKMLQVVLGAEKRKEQQAPLRRVAAVQENCERPAEVRHGERQVWQGVGHRRRP